MLSINVEASASTEQFNNVKGDSTKCVGGAIEADLRLKSSEEHFHFAF